MAETRAYHTATLLSDGSVLVTGGGDFADVGNSRLASAEIWDPETGTFSPAGTMAEGRFLHSATLLPDGRVLVVGGNWPPPIASATAEESGTLRASRSPRPGRSPSRTRPTRPPCCPRVTF